MLSYSFHPTTAVGASSAAINNYANCIDKTVGDTTTYGYRTSNPTTDTAGSVALYYGCNNAELLSKVNNGAKIKNIYAIAKFVSTK